jgi:hypothetical protein
VSDDDLFDQASAAQVDQSQAADDFLMGEGVPSATFKVKNKVVKGIVLSTETRDQTEYKTGTIKRYDDGNIARQLVVVIQTEDREDIVNSETGEIRVKAEDDHGRRALYIKGQMKAAARDAVKAAGAKGIRPGGFIAVRWADSKPSGKGNPIKVYEVGYRPPGATESAAPAEKAKTTGIMDQLKASTAKAKASRAEAASDEPDF